MTVADSDGDIDTDEITIFMGVSPNKIYLSIELRGYTP